MLFIMLARKKNPSMNMSIAFVYQIGKFPSTKSENGRQEASQVAARVLPKEHILVDSVMDKYRLDLIKENARSRKRKTSACFDAHGPASCSQAPHHCVLFFMFAKINQKIVSI